jgi:hypothetical protein
MAARDRVSADATDPFAAMTEGHMNVHSGSAEATPNAAIDPAAEREQPDRTHTARVAHLDRRERQHRQCTESGRQSSAAADSPPRCWSTWLLLSISVTLRRDRPVSTRIPRVQMAR